MSALSVQSIAIDSSRNLQQQSESELPSIVEQVQATPTLSTLAFILTQPAYSSLLETLSGPEPFTVFAPTDAAFAAAFASSGIDVSDVATISAVLKYHVVAGAVPSSALAPSQSVATLQGESLLIAKNSAGVTVNGNDKVVVADMIASNGVVHVVDSVLLPSPFKVPAPVAKVVAVLRGYWSPYPENNDHAHGYMQGGFSHHGPQAYAPQAYAPQYYGYAPQAYASPAYAFQPYGPQVYATFGFSDLIFDFTRIILISSVRGIIAVSHLQITYHLL
jgi:uncharacterized surface protein with fasciclin (FAS1) repeats